MKYAFTLELGHRANPLSNPQKTGFTHEWTVYVRGTENSIISHFVDQVVFHLHDTFVKPERVVKEPPYHVSEMGNADFFLLIDIHFKNNEEPKKVRFNYDLFLPMSEPVNYVRCEKLIFCNPTEEFKEMLLKGGATMVIPPGETPSESPKKQKTVTSKNKVAAKQRPSLVEESSKSSTPAVASEDISNSTKSHSKSESLKDSHMDSDFHSKGHRSSLSSSTKERHSSKESSKDSSKDSSSHSSSKKQTESPVSTPTQKRLVKSPKGEIKGLSGVGAGRKSLPRAAKNRKGIKN